MVRSPCNIDGRVKLEEFRRIINKIIAILKDPRTFNTPNRKLMSVFKMYVTTTTTTGAASEAVARASYDQFCSEFTRDERVALSNLGGEGAQLYILPPAFRDSVSLFESLESAGLPPLGAGADDQTVLFGIITSKEPGPDEYVNAPSAAAPLVSAASTHAGDLLLNFVIFDILLP